MRRTFDALRSEISCRVEHGADSNGHLEALLTLSEGLEEDDELVVALERIAEIEREWEEDLKRIAELEAVVQGWENKANDETETISDYVKENDELHKRVAELKAKLAEAAERERDEARQLLCEALDELKKSHGAWNLDRCEHDDCQCDLCARLRSALKGGA